MTDKAVEQVDAIRKLRAEVAEKRSQRMHRAREATDRRTECRFLIRADESGQVLDLIDEMMDELGIEQETQE